VKSERVVENRAPQRRVVRERHYSTTRFRRTYAVEQFKIGGEV